MTWSSLPVARRLSALAGWLLLASVMAFALVPDEAILRPKVLWGRGALVTAACMAMAAAALVGRIEFRWRAFLVASLLPAAVAILRAVAGPLDSEALARDEVGRLLLLPLATWTASAALTSPRARERFILALSLAGIWVGGYALMQRLGGLIPLGVTPTSRAHGGFGNPVFLGAWLVLTTPLLLAEALTEPGRGRWLAALAAGLSLPALLGTGSAGAWLGLAAALAVAVVLIVPASRVLNLAFAAAGLGILALLLVHPDVLLRPRTHGLIWRDTLGMCLARPWGVGPGQYPVAFLPFASEELLAAHPRGSVIVNDAHCEALQVLAELGWPGLIVLLWVLSALAGRVRGVLGAPAERAKDAARLAAALAAVAGCVAQSFVSPDLRFHVSTAMLGLLLGFVASYDDSEPLAFRGGRVVRGLVVAGALAGMTATAWGTWDNLTLAGRLPPSPPLELTAADAVRLAKLRDEAARFPDDPGAQYDLATALAGLRRHDEAALVMRRAHALAPGNPSVLRSLAILEGLAGNFASAQPLLESALVTAPEDLDLRYLLAFCAFGRGDVRTAILQAEAVLAADPTHVRARLLLSRLRE